MDIVSFSLKLCYFIHLNGFFYKKKIENAFTCEINICIEMLVLQTKFGKTIQAIWKKRKGRNQEMTHLFQIAF